MTTRKHNHATIYQLEGRSLEPCHKQSCATSRKGHVTQNKLESTCWATGTAKLATRQHKHLLFYELERRRGLSKKRWPFQEARLDNCVHCSLSSPPFVASIAHGAPANIKISLPSQQRSFTGLRLNPYCFRC